MFNIGFSELIILAVIGLIVIGPEHLPDMARKLAKMLNELKRAKEEIMSPVNDLKNEAHRAVVKIRKDVDEQMNEHVSGLIKIKQQAMAALNEEESYGHKDQPVPTEDESDDKPKKS